METSQNAPKNTVFSFEFDNIEILSIKEGKKRKISGTSVTEFVLLTGFVVNKEVNSLYDYYKYLVSFRDGKKALNEIAKTENLHKVKTVSRFIKIEFIFNKVAYFIILDLVNVGETLALGNQKLFSFESKNKTDRTKNMLIS